MFGALLIYGLVHIIKRAVRRIVPKPLNPAAFKAPERKRISGDYAAFMFTFDWFYSADCTLHTCQKYNFTLQQVTGLKLLFQFASLLELLELTVKFDFIKAKISW